MLQVCFHAPTPRFFPSRSLHDPGRLPACSPVLFELHRLIAFTYTTCCAKAPFLPAFLPRKTRPTHFSARGGLVTYHSLHYWTYCTIPTLELLDENTTYN